jgi:hypothetical protein
MPYEYQFPEKNPFRASEVTDLKFKIESQPNWIETLCVDLDSIRSKSLVRSLDFLLGIQEEELQNPPNQYQKLVVSGHMGCGKSVELLRYTEKINRPKAYFVVMVDLEKEMNIEQLEAEDIVVGIIAILVRELKGRGVAFEEDDFAAIGQELISEEENAREVTKELGVQAEAKVSLGWNFWKFLGLDGNLKGAYARNNKTTQIVRSAIKANSKPVLGRLNTALIGLRQNLQKQGKGQDLLFVIDGLEKANREVYESLFVKDIQLITGINAQMISTVPIRTYYEIGSTGSRDIFNTTCLPMFRINDQSKPLLRELVFRRVSPELFEEGVIDRLVGMSGGCPRILLKLVNRCIVSALGRKVLMSSVDEVLREEGMERWGALTQRHRDVLKSGQFEAADPDILDLLQYLSLLEYNGQKRERKINPLIAPFVAEMA